MTCNQKGGLYSPGEYRFAGYSDANILSQNDLGRFCARLGILVDDGCNPQPRMNIRNHPTAKELLKFPG